MIDREWTDRSTEWTQTELHAYVRQMGINPDPLEIIPQGVKFLVWPQPPLSANEIKRYREIAAMFDEGMDPIAIIPRRKDARRN